MGFVGLDLVTFQKERDRRKEDKNVGAPGRKKELEVVVGGKFLEVGRWSGKRQALLERRRGGKLEVERKHLMRSPGW